ncbi:MAG: autoinducer synthase [Hyphomonadaceae bacterium]|nr:autoinducer synthase [Hyphomonadaceae bacterium]
MHRHRHRIFVDLLGWRALARPDERDIDAFDDGRAHYIIVTDEGGAYRASARLLPTDGPHMLSEAFADFVDGDLPRGPDILEWTRHAPGDPDWPAAVNEAARLALHIGILEFALQYGITAFTALLEAGLARRARGYGWDCTPLGAPHTYAEGEAIAVLNPVRAAHLAALRLRAGLTAPILVDAAAAAIAA